MTVLEIEKLTPMMQQWKECKDQAKDTLLFFRLGDFYEAFYEDAIILSKELDLTLTKRQDVPMCGIPAHTSDTYVERLVNRGFRIAIAEQVEDPKKAKGLVKRQIVQVFSPGAYINGNTCAKNNTFFAALSTKNGLFGLALTDLTSQSVLLFECSDTKDLLNELFRHRPKEILVGKRFKERNFELLEDIARNVKTTLTAQEEWLFDAESATSRLMTHFRLITLDGFGVKKMEPALISAGALLQYITDTLLLPCDHIRSLEPIHDATTLLLDRATMANLELVEPLETGKEKNTLFCLLDETKTPMGTRLLKRWIKSPLINVEAIQQRQEAVAELMEERFEPLAASLEKIRDLERLLMRIKTGYAGPREYIALSSSCSELPLLTEILESAHSERLQALSVRTSSHTKLVFLIQQTLVDEPPLRISDGGAFKKGYCQELDELMELRHSGHTWLANYQTKLREETGIRTLKVGYNKMFGYYIEVSRAQQERVPATLQRRQTLVNGERYISEELKRYEEKIMSSDARIQTLEQTLFSELQKSVTQYHSSILETAQALAEIDVLNSLATVAKKHRYTRPLVDNSNTLHVEGGRHPVIETNTHCGKFIPNDTEIGGGGKTLMLITGPNMAGKSTYIRQVALLVIMTHIGSFIPATKAHIGIVDKVFSRIGANDDLARGQSTFMVEMAETASILNQATEKSLIILDEIGRGTSTYDGISIAWAVAEFLVRTPAKRAKTLFATHYFELTELEQKSPFVTNHTVAISETAQGIVFLHKIVSGKADKSYGIHVAKIAGLPHEVIVQAEKLLSELQKKPSTSQEKPVQADFFSQKLLETESTVIKQIKAVPINSTTPFEALQLLQSLQKMLQK